MRPRLSLGTSQATRMERIVLFAAAAVIFTGCSTELEINAPYEDNTIVYGLLNMRDSVHLVKINKAFLGEASAYDMALVQDSSEYGGEAITEAVVNRLDADGDIVETYALHDTLITNREPGTFYSPDQKLFYFRTPFAQNIPSINGAPTYLWQDDRYELRLVVKGRTLTAIAPIVNDFPINSQDFSTDAKVNLMNPVGSGYVNYEFNWTSRADCKRFIVSYRFNYKEIRGPDTLERSIVQQIGSRVTQNSQNNEEMALVFGGESVYNTISTVIRSDPNHASADRRIFNGFDFLVSVANDDFHTYLSLTEPVSGIVEDRPAYSNIAGAYGVWGSRLNKNVIGKWFNGASFEELVNGPKTSDLKFCYSIEPGGPLICD